MLYTFIDPPSERDIKLACDVLTSGGTLAYPTDVNWAFGCDAANPKALDKIKKLKPCHPKDRPFSLICDSISMAASVATIDSQTYRLLRRALPGPFTVILPASKSLPKQLHEKRTTVGVRIPDSPLLLAITAQFGKPLATTSVPSISELSTHTPPNSKKNLARNLCPVIQDIPRFGYEVQEHFGHALDIILDLGDEIPASETTVIDLTSFPPMLVRQGVGDLALFDL